MWKSLLRKKKHKLQIKLSSEGGGSKIFYFLINALEPLRPIARKIKRKLKNKGNT